MVTRRAMQRRRAKVLRQLQIIESIAMILFGICVMAALFFGCCVDGPNWEIALALFIAFIVLGVFFYQLAVWAHDKEV